MAKMYPERLRPETESAAERLLYGELRRQLPESVAVLHGVCWLGRDGRGEHDRDGEADFVIVDPARGVLVLEVKGGLVGRDGATGRWTSLDRHGRVHEITDPLAQAKRNVHALLRALRDAPATRPHAGTYRLQRAVAFPDGVAEGIALGADAHPGIVIGREHLADLRAAVERALGEPDPSRRPPGAAFAALVSLLAPTWRVRAPRLGETIGEDAARYIELTEDQFRLLDTLRLYRRFAVAGCAGSGKTLLAVEQARRLAGQGFRVLLTCYNRALAGWLREHMRESLGDAPADLWHVATFHDLAAEVCRRGGNPLPDGERLPEDERNDFYDIAVPNRFYEAAGNVPDAERFDAVIVDEAQDIRGHWWLPLVEMLRDPEQGPLYVFYDSNQRLYVPETDLPINTPPFSLPENLRTTRTIHALAMRFHAGDDAPRCRGPEGRAPERVPVELGEELEALRRVLTRLLRDEGAPPEQIVVLTPRSRRTSALAQGAEVGNGLRLTWDEAGPGELRVRSVHAYKGLEAPVVIYAEPERAHAASRAMLHYVALSRAQSHLVVLGALPG